MQQNEIMPLPIYNIRWRYGTSVGDYYFRISECGGSDSGLVNSDAAPSKSSRIGNGCCSSMLQSRGWISKTGAYSENSDRRLEFILQKSNQADYSRLSNMSLESSVSLLTEALLVGAQFYE